MSNLGNYTSWTDEMFDQDKKDTARRKKTAFFKAKQGRNGLRVCPARPGSRVFVHVSRHSVMVPGRAYPSNFTCPRAHGGRFCQTCAVADKLKATGNKADFEKARTMFPRMRTFTNIVERDAPERGVQVWEMSGTQYETLKQLRADKDAGGDFVDPMTGFDLILHRTGEKKETRYSVAAARSSSPLAPSEDALEALMASANDLDRFADAPSDETIEAILAGDPVEDGPPRGRTAGDDIGEHDMSDDGT